MHDALRRLVLATATILALGLVAGPAAADWQQDGVIPLMFTFSSPAAMRAVSDGAGGTIVVWWDWGGTGYHIFAQRLDPWGRFLWDAGQTVAPVASNQSAPEAVADGVGGVLVTWLDTRSGNAQLYAQRLDAAGTRLWGDGGVAVAPTTGGQAQYSIDADGAGGFFAAWQEDRGNGFRVYAQHISLSGYPAWPATGVRVTTAEALQSFPTIAADGLFGAWVAWNDGRSADLDIYAQHVTSGGSLVYGGSAYALCTAAGLQFDVHVVADGTAGACFQWTDQRTLPALYAQRIDGNHNTRWATNGILVMDQLSGNDARVAADGQGGLYVLGTRSPGGSNLVLSLGRITAAGTSWFGSAGAPIVATNQFNYAPRLAVDLDGSIVVAWQDDRSVYEDIYVQKVDAYGTPQWQADGVRLCGASGNQNEPALALDGQGGAVVAWSDYRGVGFGMPAAQHVDGYGNWGLPAPAIASVRDVPGDQGGRVNLAFAASRLDPWPASAIASYTLWRAIPAGAKQAVPAEARIVTPDQVPAALKDAAGSVLRAANPGEKTAYWELVGTVGAYHLATYAATVATLFDSTATVTAVHTFQVMAHGVDPGQYWISAPASGVSVDNLAPAAPAGLRGAFDAAAAAVALAWHPSPETDLGHYELHRGADAAFVPGPDSFVAASTDTLYVDPAWLAGGSWYKLVAVDIHGNAGPAAVLALSIISAAGDAPRAVTGLNPVAPNPFNPATVVSWSLARPGAVEVRICDVAGRLVRTVRVDQAAAGPGAFTWDGTDDGGRPVASGVYQVLMRADGATFVQKATLLK